MSLLNGLVTWVSKHTVNELANDRKVEVAIATYKLWDWSIGTLSPYSVMLSSGLDWRTV